MPGADREDRRVLAEQARVLEEERQQRVLPVLAVRTLRRFEARNDVVDSLPDRGVREIA